MTKGDVETIEMSVTDARKSFLALVDNLTDEGVLCVTKHGKPAVAMIPWRTYKRAQEVLATVEVLSDPDLMEQIRQGERELEVGEGIAIEDLRAEISRDLAQTEETP